jgi:hypothetical protein
MASVVPERFTADADGPIVVFLIGMRVNKLWAVRKWLPVARAMGPMLETLYGHPEKGFLGAQTLLAWRGVTMVQYWRSAEDLMRFAHAPEEPHLGPWRRFMKEVGGDGTVGIWHETYVVQPGHAEAIYGNMPVFGLAAATRHVPATGRRYSARERLALDSGRAARAEGHGAHDDGERVAAPATQPAGA